MSVAGLGVRPKKYAIVLDLQPSPAFLQPMAWLWNLDGMQGSMSGIGEQRNRASADMLVTGDVCIGAVYCVPGHGAEMQRALHGEASVSRCRMQHFEFFDVHEMGSEEGRGGKGG